MKSLASIGRLRSDQRQKEQSWTTSSKAILRMSKENRIDGEILNYLQTFEHYIYTLDSVMIICKSCPCKEEGEYA